MNQPIHRRTVLSGAAALGVGATLPRIVRAASKPKSPLTVTIVDVAGNLALTQKAFEAYQKQHPDMVGRFVFTKAPAPELASKLRAQQDANRVDIDIVLTGTDALAAGIDQKIWVDLAKMPGLPNLSEVLLEPALKMQALAQDQGVIINYCPGGPILEYMPDRVKQPPTSIEELMDWAKANPNRFMYARPANSGPGRAFLMGVPYLLGDKDPKDPVKGWDKTWAYLEKLGEYIEYYPTGTGATMKELGEGSRDMIATMTGWDINPRALGIVPKEAKISLMKGFKFVVDGQYICVPKGRDAERMAVLLDITEYMLSKPAQAYSWDEGYFYPGPAVKDVPLSMAPKSSQDVIRDYGRPEYPKLIADTPTELPLDAQKMVTAFSMWDQKVGAKKKS